MGSGQIDKAIEYLKMAIEVEPNFSEAWTTLANCYLYKNDSKNVLRL